MQQAGLQTGFRQRVASGSAVRFQPARCLRSLIPYGGRLWIAKGIVGPTDGATSPYSGQGSAAREPASQSATGGVAFGGSSNSSAEVLCGPGADMGPSNIVAASGSVISREESAAAESAAGPTAAAGSPQAGQQQQQQEVQGAPIASPSALGKGAAEAATSAGTASSTIPQLVQQLLAWLTSVWSALQQFPIWVQMQHLRRLREACEEAPKDADKHAAYLAELGRSNPREVLARVESRHFGVNAAVVAEYLRALVATGKVTELVKADGSAAAAAASATVAAAVAPAALEVPPPRTLAELLRDLHEQLVLASVDGATPGDGAAPVANGIGGAAASLEIPGSSLRRPLHVVVGGLPPLQPMVSTAPQVSKTPLLLRPLALLWRLISAAVLVLVLAFAYIAGSQAIRRVQASGGAFVNPATVNTGPPVSAAGGGGGSGAATSSSGSGGPGVEPKEYKKDEMPEKSIRTFKDVKGCDEAKEELREVVEFLKHPSKFTRLGAKLPKGVLLTGPPGTGKTLLAKAVAGEAGVPFFYRAGSEFEELYVGVGSRRMRALFAAAKKRSPCIVFIDEIDAIGGNRKAWENHTRKTLNQLLVEMDGFESTDGIIVMAATNLPESLDPALKRPGRFDRQVAVPLPDIKGRRDILEYYLSDKPLGPDVDRELLARQTQGFSGADLSNLINEGAILAAKEGSEAITQRMFDWAYDKILMGVERKSVKRTLEARRRTAFHEAGHALVALLTPGASPIHKATIVPRGHALGMVMQVGREDEFSINRQQMLARIRVCMGGTVAEELVFGSDQVSSGATDDLRQATSMARHMVTECGMSTAIGPVYVAANDERHGGTRISEATRQRVDAEVAAMLGDAKEAVRALLADRMQDLTALAEALLDRETLTRDEINTLLQQRDQQTPPSGGGGAGRRDHDGDQPPQLEGDPAPAAAQVASRQADASVSQNIVRDNSSTSGFQQLHCDSVAAERGTNPHCAVTTADDAPGRGEMAMASSASQWGTATTATSGRSGAGAEAGEKGGRLRSRHDVLALSEQEDHEWHLDAEGGGPGDQLHMPILATRLGARGRPGGVAWVVDEGLQA
ncbi:hypothetical protein VaNZ11_011879 [Volvox africanus]|uniref:AAA+ ATPase domain-containing protein n=1 Tax=Volvox africanus TaxID=51714 RepID=A0ABQ5SDB1_9CHLO|nr:hypothetical protein VaNZ11_011879 [Volvox africanus]